MPKKISWKKGMRLTDEVMLASDACTADYVNQALMLAAGGRFGLFPSTRPFMIQLSINKGFIEVEAINCLAITRGGVIIDAQFDTRFNNTIDGRVQIPNDSDDREFILTINARPDDWKETSDGYMEQNYTFALVSSKTGISDYAMPVSRIVYEDGWREDNTKFVPPCLCITAHPKFEELHTQFLQLLRNIDETTSQQLETAARTAITIYWPVVKQMLIKAGTEHDVMTPQELMACVQRVVGSFVLACEVDDMLELAEANTFRNYSVTPYSYRIAYLRIKQGLGMVYAIGEKVEKLNLIKRVEPQKPDPPKPDPEPEPKKPEPKKPEPQFDPRRIWDGKRI